MRTIAYLLTALLIFSCDKNKSITNDKHNRIVTEITNYLDTLDGFSGTILIAKNDRILLKKAYGYAHLGHQIKNNIDTRFSYASIGKSFTATAIFQLIQSGKLSLNNTIGDILPNYPNAIARDSITIKMLLQHRSGLPNYFHSEKYLNTSKEQFRTLESITSLYENESLEFKPNEQFSYRNTNYIVLGRIIENITKMPYEEYIHEHIFLKANMKHTGNYNIDLPIENAAENYTLSTVFPNKLQKTIFMSAVKGSPAGGGYSTVTDLYKFVVAFKDHILLNEEHTNFMKTAPEDGSYGYGMQFAGAKKSGIYGHSGGHFGTGAEWRVYEKQNYTVILLTNKDLDQGFLDARFFIEKTIAGTTPKLESYFFTKEMIDVYLKEGLEQAKKMIEDSKIKLSEIELNTKGYEMIKRKLYNKAIDLFTLEALSFPNSYDAYDSLGEAYLLNNQINEAIKNYKKSLILNPENTHVKEKIKEITEQKSLTLE